MKILTILGTRPQFIKSAPLSKAFLEDSTFEEIILHTGQHYDIDMNAVFFDTLKLKKPKYKLSNGQKSHAKMTADILKDTESILLQEKPDFTLVYGDTNSTLAGALASSKLHIPIIHIEAGLRSFDLSMPEEINRILTDRISKFLFCPTQKALQNLHNEGFLHFDCKIKNTGDIMLESSLMFKDFAKKPLLNLQKNFILCTIHRPHNTDNPQHLKAILQALEIIAEKTQVLLPLHPRVAKSFDSTTYKNITFCKPLDYLQMLWILKHTQAVITDSGGLQKESYFFQKPCLVLRENSEWIELVENRYNILVGNNKEKIIATFDNITKICNTAYTQNFYGNADSSKQIIQTLKAF